MCIRDRHYSDRYCSTRERSFDKGLLAQQLHEKGFVHKGFCGIPEVDKFQTVVDNYQIIVSCTKQSNVIVYEGANTKFIFITVKTIMTSSLGMQESDNENEKHRCSM